MRVRECDAQMRECARVRKSIRDIAFSVCMRIFPFLKKIVRMSVFLLQNKKVRGFDRIFFPFFFVARAWKQ